MNEFWKYSKGSVWRKWDLQVGTNKYNSYSGLALNGHDLEKLKNLTCLESSQINSDHKTLSNEEYAKLFVEYLVHLTDVKVVCIANHNTGDGIQELVDYLKQKQDYSDLSNPYNDTLIFPGVEIGGNDKCHLVIAFNPNTKISHKFLYKEDGKTIKKELNWFEYIERFLSDIYIPNPRFLNSQPCNSSKYGALDIIGKAQEWDFVPIFPHIENKDGLWQELQDNNRKEVYLHPNFGVVDISDNSKNSDLKRILDGNHLSWGKKKIATIASSDSNSLARIGARFSWIKADPCYNGLKQIMYEPELRVSNKFTEPIEKAPYQIIDKIEINNEIIQNTILQFNPYLNSIIGGRSTGKSILLASIARKLKTDEPVVFEDKLDYDKIIDETANSLTIYWKDGVVANDREVEFFRQGYMYNIARDENQKNKLIQKILKLKGKELLLSKYSKSISDIKKRISDFINDYFLIDSELKENQIKVLDKGDKKGIEEEISRLSIELNKLNAFEITSDDKQTYTEINEKIENLSKGKSINENDILIIESLKALSVFKDSLSYELTSVSDFFKKKVEAIFEDLKLQTNQTWLVKIEEQIKILKTENISFEKEYQESLKNEAYTKVANAYKQSTQFSEIEARIKKEKDKLQEITVLESEIKEQVKQKATLYKSLKECFSEFHTKIQEITPLLSASVDDLEIVANAELKSKKIVDFLSNSLNKNRKHNLIYLSGAYVISNQPTIDEFVFQVFEDLLLDKLVFKDGFDKLSFANNLLAENYYEINYDLIYDGDNFAQMSEGKKAFVILKLLLDFSNKECPILIDQPEDDLDNRAIYTELVKYIRKKKIERQIILATHNPNIVVSSDSELVIVANQHGVKNKNVSEKKFQYVQGSLENSRKKNNDIPEILNSQGIREHVCDILEGGTVAFVNRERKYDIQD